MESVYNAANAASRALFGENRNSDSVTTDNERQSHETNPFRQATERDNDPFHHSATTSTAKPYDSSPTGFGSQHTAGSGPELNKPVTTGFGTGTSYDSGATNPSVGVGSATRSYDEPSSSDLDKSSTTGTYEQQSSSNTPSGNSDKPTTTTNTFSKNSVGSLNTDGTRHETNGDNLDRSTHDSNYRPTTSSIYKDSSNKPFTSRFSEDTTISPSSGAGSLDKPSTTSYSEHEHIKDPTHFEKPDTHSSTTQGAGALTAGVCASGYHASSTDFSKSSTDSSTNIPYNNRDNEQHRLGTTSTPDFPQDNCEHTPHHHSRATAQGSNIQSLIESDLATSASGAPTTAKPTSTYNPPSAIGASTHGAATSGVEIADATPMFVTSAIGSGPGAAVEPSVGAHPTHTQQSPKQQDANKPLEEPSSEGTHNTPEKKEEGVNHSTSKGTGELYEKSTGVAADGGDFDASRPGAGREADRLLDQEGIHHGADLRSEKPDISNIAAGHRKLFPGHKDKSANKPAHDKHSSDHATGKDTATDHHDATAESGHKGLGSKIKEKLHIGHH